MEKFAIVSPNQLDITTNTIVANTNFSIDLELFFDYMPISPSKVTYKRSVGKHRRNCRSKAITNIPPGSIISLQRNVSGKGKRNVRGILLKQKSKNTTNVSVNDDKDDDDKKEVRGVLLKQKNKGKFRTFFLNSVTTVLVIANDKQINVKVSSNGTLHITGCKSDQHCLDAIKYLYQLMQETSRRIGRKIVTVDTPVIYLRIVMRNYRFTTGFPIDREKLNNFIYFNTENMLSQFEPCSCCSPCVIIRIPCSKKEYSPIQKVILEENSKSIESIFTTIPYEEYLDTLSEKDRKHEIETERRHTFLCFASGKCILSTHGCNVPGIYEEFLRLLFQNKPLIEDLSKKRYLLK